MSVVGFDLGCDLSKVAVAHRKKILVVPNDITKLSTPSLTAFTAKERCFGDNALTQWARNYKSTVSQLKRWIGRKGDDPITLKEAQFWLPGITTGTLPDGRFGIDVETSQGKLLLAPEQILCGYLSSLKKFTSKFLDGIKVQDCVIACPSYYDDSQRRALLTAAKLAELKVLRILEEPTAIALCYGILRPLPENETQRVVFVDVGYASTQVAVVDFVKGKLSVRYKASNPFVGGRNFDRALFEHFRAEWLAKKKVDIETLPRQKLKLLRACKRVKKLLTGNKDALWTLDCFHDDNDFKMEMHRSDMEEICTKNKVYEGILEPLMEAMEAIKDDENVKIHSCEIIGGPSRIPSVQAKVLEIIQKYEPSVDKMSTTLNGDESVARGCALMCAMLSPNYRVKEFQVQDILTWPITINYPTEKEDSDKKNIEQLIMQRGNPQPCTAKVMFNKTKNFVFQLQHPTQYKTKDLQVNVEYPFATNLGIGEFSVQLLPLSEKAVQAPKIKLLLDINKQGLLDWPKASLIEYVKREPKVEPKKEEKAKKDDTKKSDDKDKDAEMTDATKEKAADSDAKPEADDATKTKEEDKKEDADKESSDKMDVDEVDEDAKNKKDKKKEKKKITRDLMITGNFFNELKASDYNKMFELEANLINVDRIVHETDEAKNDLETYVYDLRDKLDTDSDFVEAKIKEETKSKLTTMEDWIYDHGDEANKTQFLEKLKELKDIGDPMAYKKWECEHRDSRVENFKKLVFKYQQFVGTEEEKYAHIDESQRKIVKKCADDADAWLTNQMIKQDKLKKCENPVLKCKDIDAKYREVYNKCNPIVCTPKPKPKPKKEEKKEDDKEKTDKKDDEATKTDDDKEKDKSDDADATMEDKSKKEDETTTTTTEDKAKVDGMDVE